MRSYKIEMLVNGFEHRKATFNGYNEQQAIAQAFLAYGYEPGVRELKVIEITINSHE